MSIRHERANVTYTPFVEEDRVGWKAERDGVVTYIYLVPSADNDAPEPTADLFLYVGEGDPDTDEPQHFYDISPELGLVQSA